MLERIEQLASEKTFDSLNTSEKAFVLSHLSREEYDQIRGILQTATTMDASVEAPERIRVRLMTQFPKAKTGMVSVWLALGILAAGWGLMWLFRPVQIREKIVPTVEVKTDTVWVERIKWREKVVYKTRSLPEPLPEPIAAIPDMVQTPNLDSGLIPTPLSQQRLGTSLGDTPELMSFFTQVNKDK